MKRIAMTMIALVTSVVMLAQKFPERNTRLYVTDAADVFSPEEEIQIDKRIRDYKATTTNEFAVVTVQSLDGYDVADYTNRLFKSWGIGLKGKNNGVMILFSPSDRKWRIEVGYGLEGVLTDLYTKNRADALMKPNFKQKKYFAGIDAVLADFMNKVGYKTYDQMMLDAKQAAELAAAQEKKAAAEREASEAAFLNGLLIFFGIVVMGGVAFFVIRYRINKKREEEEARAAKQKRMKQKRDNILALKSYHENNRKRVETIENYRYNIGQSNLRTRFNDAVSKVSGIQITETLFEAELDEMLIQLTAVTGQTTSLMQELEKRMKQCDQIEKHHNSVSSIVNDITSAAHGEELISKNIKSRYPSEVWSGSLSSDLTAAVMATLKNGSNLANQAFDAVKNGGNLDQAFSTYEKSVQTFNSARSTCAGPSKLKIEIDRAESGLSSSLREVDELVSKATSKCHDSDVSSSTRSKLSRAKSDVDTMKRNSTNNPVKKYKLAQDCISELKSVIRQAERDIDDAESERRRERERQSSYSSSYSSSSSSSSWGSSSSSSDWGSSSSFGGGDSGGGGSSGDW